MVGKPQLDRLGRSYRRIPATALSRGVLPSLASKCLKAHATVNLLDRLRVQDETGSENRHVSEASGAAVFVVLK